MDDDNDDLDCRNTNTVMTTMMGDEQEGVSSCGYDCGCDRNDDSGGDTDKNYEEDQTVCTNIDERIRELTYWYSILRQNTNTNTRTRTDLNQRQGSRDDNDDRKKEATTDKDDDAAKYERSFWGLLRTIPRDDSTYLYLKWQYHPNLGESSAADDESNENDEEEEEENNDAGEEENAEWLGGFGGRSCFELFASTNPPPNHILHDSPQRPTFSIRVPLVQRPLPPEHTNGDHNDSKDRSNDDDSVAYASSSSANTDIVGTVGRVLSRLLSLIALLSKNVAELELEGFGSRTMLEDDDSSLAQADGEVYSVESDLGPAPVWPSLPDRSEVQYDDLHPFAGDSDSVESPFSVESGIGPAPVRPSLSDRSEAQYDDLDPFPVGLLVVPVGSDGDRCSSSSSDDDDDDPSVPGKIQRQGTLLPVVGLDTEDVFRAFATEESSCWRSKRLAVVRVRDCAMLKDNVLCLREGHYPEGLEEVYVHDPKRNTVSSSIFEIATRSPELKLLYAFDSNNLHSRHNNLHSRHALYSCRLTEGATMALCEIMSRTNGLFGMQQLPYRELFHLPNESIWRLIRATTINSTARMRHHRMRRRKKQKTTTAGRNNNKKPCNTVVAEDNIPTLLRDHPGHGQGNHLLSMLETIHTCENSLGGLFGTRFGVRDCTIRSSAFNFCLVLKRTLEVLWEPKGQHDTNDHGTNDDGHTNTANTTATTSANTNANTTTTNAKTRNPGSIGLAKVAPNVLARCQTKPFSLLMFGHERDLLFMVLQESLPDILSSRPP